MCVSIGYTGTPVCHGVQSGCSGYDLSTHVWRGIRIRKNRNGNRKTRGKSVSFSASVSEKRKSMGVWEKNRKRGENSRLAQPLVEQAVGFEFITTATHYNLVNLP